MRTKTGSKEYVFSVVVELDTSLHSVMQLLSLVNWWYFLLYCYISNSSKNIGLFSFCAIILLFRCFACMLLFTCFGLCWQVERRIDLVYGGGRLGLMGLISQTVLNGGCHVLGYLFFIFLIYYIRLLI